MCARRGRRRCEREKKKRVSEKFADCRFSFFFMLARAVLRASHRHRHRAAMCVSRAGSADTASAVVADKAALRRAARDALRAADAADLDRQSEMKEGEGEREKEGERGATTASTRPQPPPLFHRHPGTSIRAHLTSAPFWTRATRVGAYLAAARLREVCVDAAVVGAINASAPTVFLPVVHPHAAAAMALLHVDSLSDDDVVVAPPFGIREPTDLYPPSSRRHPPGTPRTDALTTGLDVLLLPGAAFDGAGRRLGRGGGYYDAFAAALKARGGGKDGDDAASSSPLLVGLAFEQQIVPTVPTEPHDVTLDVLITAARGCVGVSERGRAALRD